MRKAIRRFVVAISIGFVCLDAPAYWESQCRDRDVATLHGAPRDNTTFDFNDYGIAFRAAGLDDPQCRIDAGRILYTKFWNSEPEDFQSFLSGALVTLSMATTLRIGGAGYLSPAQDAAARDMGRMFEGTYAAYDPCGFEGDRWMRANTCMDDHAVAASGYAWVTAFQRLTGREWQTSRAKTVDWIKRAFRTSDSICIHDPDRYVAGETPCNATVAELGAGRTRIISLNHGNQTPAYGLGLMASIAAAFVALEAAGVPIDPVLELSADERKIIEYLWIEGQEHTDAFGNFHSDSCYNMNAATRTLEKPWGCHDQQFVSGDPNDPMGSAWWPMDRGGVTGYQARWYNLLPFYEKYGFGTGSPHGYRFDRSVDTFDKGAGRFFGPGRRETFVTLAGEWIEESRRPRLEGSHLYAIAIMPAPDASVFVSYDPHSPFVLETGATVITGFEVFFLYDMDRGTLDSGSPVLLRLPDGRYIAAQGSGDLEVIELRGPTPPRALWRIEKVSEDPRFIAHGDRFALVSPSGQYLTVDRGGALRASANARTERETFVFFRVETTRSR